LIINKKMLAKIEELQNETIQKAKKVEGSSEYIKKKVELFHEAEKYRKSLSLQITPAEMKATMQFTETHKVDMEFLKGNKNLQKEIDMLRSIIQEQEKLSNLFLSA